jgi:hypothetical protein
MKKRVSVLIICICSSLRILAQSDTSNAVILKIAPLAAVDMFSRPMIQMGCEYYFNPQWSLEPDLGIKYMENNKADTSHTNSKGYSIRLELKRYNPSWLEAGPTTYVACQFYYIKDDYNFAVQFYPDSASHEHHIQSSIKTDDFAVLKNIYGINFKIGYVMAISKRIVIDLYGGLGIR